MGRLKKEERDQHISLKELRELCKQHGLPAYGKKHDLAISLESFFANFTTSKDCHAPSSSEQRPKYLAKSAGESFADFRRRYVPRKNSSVSGAYKRIACLKENRTKRKREREDARNAEVSPETCQPDLAERRPELKQASRTTPYVRCHTEGTGQCSTSRILSKTDELQFFVSSEDGINLHVALDSMPFDWIKSFKKEICLSQAVSHEMRTLPCVNNQINTSSMDFKVSDGSSECDDSPLSSHLSNISLHAEDDMPKSPVQSFQFYDAASNLVGNDSHSSPRDVETYISCNSSCVEKLSSASSRGDLDEERSRQFDRSDHPIFEVKSSLCLSDERCDAARSYEDCNEEEDHAEASGSKINRALDAIRSYQDCDQENHDEASGRKVMRPLDVEYHTSDDTSRAHVLQDLVCSANNGESARSQETPAEPNEPPKIKRRGRPRKYPKNTDMAIMPFRRLKTDASDSSSRSLALRRRSTRLTPQEP